MITSDTRTFLHCRIDLCLGWRPHRNVKSRSRAAYAPLRRRGRNPLEWVFFPTHTLGFRDDGKAGPSLQMELKKASDFLTLIEYESMAGSSNFSGDVLKWVTPTWHFDAATVGIQQIRALRFRRLHESRISTFYSGHASVRLCAGERSLWAIGTGAHQASRFTHQSEFA